MSLEQGIIGGLVAIIVALLAWLRFFRKDQAETTSIFSDADKKSAETGLLKVQTKKEQIALTGAEEEHEIKSSTIKEEHIQRLINAHKAQTEQYTKLIARYAELEAKFADSIAKLQDAETLRRYFEKTAADEKLNFTEAAKKLENVTLERDEYKKQAERVVGLERRVESLELFIRSHNLEFSEADI